ATDLHLHVRDFPGGPRDLLHLEQPALGRAAICDDAPPGRRGASLRESQAAQSVRRRQSRRCYQEMTEVSDEAEAARKFFAGPCDFIWGATSVENLPPAKLPEVAFVGRSNAGKSSLFN